MGTSHQTARSEVVPAPYEYMEQWDFAQAVIVEGPMIMGSGQCGIGPDGERVGDDFESQLRAAFENIRAVLEQAGVGLEHVVKLTLYMADADDLESYPPIRREFFQEPFPLSTCIVAAPMLGFRVEVEFTATLGSPLRASATA